MKLQAGSMRFQFLEDRHAFGERDLPRCRRVDDGRTDDATPTGQDMYQSVNTLRGLISQSERARLLRGHPTTTQRHPPATGSFPPAVSLKRRLHRGNSELCIHGLPQSQF